MDTTESGTHSQKEEVLEERLRALEESRKQACSAAIARVLQEFECTLVFRQSLVNGIPAGGEFGVEVVKR